MVKRITTTILPTNYGEFTLHLYNETNTGKEHLALVCGDLTRQPILTRIHSACLTGDVFGSLRCDCQQQLQQTLQILQTQGGVLIYLNQEGRGVGLTNKIKAYALQDQGLDTVQANEKLGFRADERDFKVAAHILKDLGISQIELLTNHPQKISDLANNGIKVSRKSLWVEENSYNHDYLQTKKNKLGHLTN